MRVTEFAPAFDTQTEPVPTVPPTGGVGADVDPLDHLVLPRVEDDPA
jgi:hypothetical protein